MSNRRIDEPTGVETVGHEWDGIEELNNPLPRWWLIVLAITVVFSLGYVVVYPAIPGLHSGSQGLWGWSSRGALAQELATPEASHAKDRALLAAMPIEEIPNNPAALAAAKAGGKAAFRQNCVQCHGTGAAGGIGYPNLNDDDWLWGGTIKDIEQTITHGIRQPGDSQTRTSMMPSFGHDGILTPAQVSQVADHVLSLSGKAPANPAGAAIFAANCVACHGPDGKGLRQFGAPNLTDAIWLYGGTKEAVVNSVTNAHAGVMPAWGTRLDPVTIKMLATYVHSLGGGEAMNQAGNGAPTAETGNAKP